MLLLVDPYYDGLGFRVAKSLNVKLVSLVHKVFPDGESYFRIVDDVSGEKVVCLVSVFPEQDKGVLRAIFLSHTLKELGAEKVIIVFPYFPYARQDKRFLPGECVSARIVAEAVFSAGADYIVTIDVHSEDVFKPFGSRFINVRASEAWAGYIKSVYNLEDVFLIAPDKGRINYIGSIASLLGIPYSGFEKVRDLITGEIKKHEPIDPRMFEDLVNSKRIAILLDDIISTGGTAAKVAKRLREEFDGRIIAGFTHGLFLPGSVEKLIKAGVDEIISTDTVKNSFSKVTVADLIANTIRKLV